MCGPVIRFAMMLPRVLAVMLPAVFAVTPAATIIMIVAMAIVMVSSTLPVGQRSFRKGQCQPRQGDGDGDHAFHTWLLLPGMRGQSMLARLNLF